MRPDECSLSLSQKLNEAIDANNLSAVRDLLADKKARDCLNLADKFGRAPLHYAILSHSDTQIELVNILCDAGANIDAADCWGKTPLHLACNGNKAGCVRALLDRGANLLLGDHDGKTALDCAIEIDDESCLQAFVEKYPELQQNVENLKLSFNFDRIKSAIEKNDIQYALSLLEEHQDCVRVIDYQGCTLLHHAMFMQKDMMRFVESLYEFGVDIDAVNYQKQSALHLASCKGHADCIRFLLGQGANIFLEDEDRRTAPHLAILLDKKECIKAFIDMCPSLFLLVNTFTQNLIHIAAKENQVACLETLLTALRVRLNASQAREVINARDVYLKTPLHYAASTGQVADVSVLLEAGADISAKDYIGWTPLSYAEVLNQDLPERNACLELLKASEGPSTKDGAEQDCEGLPAQSVGSTLSLGLENANSSPAAVASPIGGEVIRASDLRNARVAFFQKSRQGEEQPLVPKQVNIEANKRCCVLL
jgi:ankyrin repeat protein